MSPVEFKKSACRLVGGHTFGMPKDDNETLYDIHEVTGCFSFLTFLHIVVLSYFHCWPAH